MRPPRPASARKRCAELVWYPQGQPLTLDGLTIPDGMVYVSTGELPWPGEPSALDLTQPIDAVAEDPAVGLGYYPSFLGITPAQRRTYLEWLASGRSDADPAARELGYVFLFFYGIERRLLLDGDLQPTLMGEVLRLLQLYGPAHRSVSLQNYCLQLLHFSGWRLGQESYRAFWPQLLELDGDRPDEDSLRFVLGNLHQRGEVMDWTVAYRLALIDEDSRKSAVVARTREKFWELFRQRFEEIAPGGMPLAAAKQPATVEYRPASGALLSACRESAAARALHERIPNVLGLRRQFRALPEIWNRCIDDLAGYSRALGSKKVGDAAKIATWQALPPELRAGEAHPLRDAFDGLLGSAPREGDLAFLPSGQIAAMAGVDERARLTLAQSKQVAELARQLGWRMAPDPRQSGLPLAWSQEVALRPTDSDDGAPGHLAGVIRLLHLAVMLAAADGVIEDEELATFETLVKADLPGEADWERVRDATAALRRDTNVAVRCLPQLAKLISPEHREQVLRSLAHIAAADREISLPEIKLLRRIARAFGLPPDAVDSLLEGDGSLREVTVATAGKGAKGERIPPRPAAAGAVLSLDSERIRALTEETRQVIAMLSEVMADEGSAEVKVESKSKEHATPGAAQAPIDAPWIEGLAERYRPVVTTLVAHDEIDLDDFEGLCKRQHLLPDDVLDAVNAWSDEHFGDFLLERGENVRVFRSLLPVMAGAGSSN
ncbi:MAG TPA: TerB N-terminal domain-containing protein [Verrucomicrobiae bacterium]|nr:TerB N-terminal domain-containing protein [Verrucomicrobiae bacterium]